MFLLLRMETVTEGLTREVHLAILKCCSTVSYLLFSLLTRDTYFFVWLRVWQEVIFVPPTRALTKGNVPELPPAIHVNVLRGTRDDGANLVRTAVLLV